MKKFVALTAVATAALAATPALAQAPQGPRVEALVGYDAPRIKVNDSGINGTLQGRGRRLRHRRWLRLRGFAASMAFGVDVEATDSTFVRKPTVSTEP